MMSLALPRRIPAHGVVGLLLVTAAWPASWLHVDLIGQYSFFPLWLGYILVVDALVFRRRGTSLFSRGPVAFAGMFLISAPLWWAFEGINKLTENWHYVGAEDYSVLRYVVVASWHFSVVIPAVFETAELVGSFGFMDRFRRGRALAVSRRFLIGAMALGLASLVALALWPRYVFPVTWLCIVLVLDPVNELRGRPSLIARLRRGDWRLVVALSLGALICGWFWEMWNFWAMPKWEYSISFVDFARVFEMPLLGYGGYLPFGLEVYAGYHFLAGFFDRSSEDILRISDP